QTRKPIATVATPMLDFTGLGILQEARIVCVSAVRMARSTPYQITKITCCNLARLPCLPYSHHHV
ncbi:hypothetical protein QN372_19205, partial [Undibacterium sp. RTI2.1]|uniref:hypothetical protein n=1 Tax=Undibacterium sp. RTI2.1 TaxID=3048637 RepID=UPI002B224EBD